MKQLSKILGLCVVLFAVGCSSTKFTQTDKAEGVGPVDFSGKKVVSLVIHSDEPARIAAEDAIAAELTKRGMAGVAAHTLISAEILRDVEKAKAALVESGAEGVVVNRLVRVDETIRYEDTLGTHHYSSLMPYYNYGWSTVYTPGYLEARAYETFVIETLCYRVSDGQKLWSGVSESFAPNSIKTLSKSLVKEAGKVMRKQGLVAK